MTSSEQAGPEAANLTGIYTYRSFLDLPLPVDSFSKLQFAQLELDLAVAKAGFTASFVAVKRDA